MSLYTDLCTCVLLKKHVWWVLVSWCKPAPAHNQSRSVWMGSQSRELMCVKCLERCLAHGKSSITICVSWYEVEYSGIGHFSVFFFFFLTFWGLFFFFKLHLFERESKQAFMGEGAGQGGDRGGERASQADSRWSVRWGPIPGSCDHDPDRNLQSSA